MKKSLFVIIGAIILILIVSFIVLSLPKDISKVKNEDFVGKTVKVSGEVKTVIKIGSLSGFTLEDETGIVAVSSEDLPKEGEKMGVKGVLIKDSLFGYYIKSE